MVYPKPGGRYGLVAGERRLRAVKKLGWDRVPVRVLEGLPDPLTLVKLTLAENEDRLPVSFTGKIGAVLRYVSLKTDRSLEEVVRLAFEGDLRNAPEDVREAFKAALESVGIPRGTGKVYMSYFRLLHREDPQLGILLLERPVSFSLFKKLVEAVLSAPRERRPGLLSRAREALRSGDLEGLLHLAGGRPPRGRVREVAPGDDASPDEALSVRSLQARAAPPPDIAPLLEEVRALKRALFRLERRVSGKLLLYREGDGDPEGLSLALDLLRLAGTLLGELSSSLPAVLDRLGPPRERRLAVERLAVALEEVAARFSSKRGSGQRR